MPWHTRHTQGRQACLCALNEETYFTMHGFRKYSSMLFKFNRMYYAMYVIIFFFWPNLRTSRYVLRTWLIHILDIWSSLVLTAELLRLRNCSTILFCFRLLRTYWTFECSRAFSSFVLKTRQVTLRHRLSVACGRVGFVEWIEVCSSAKKNLKSVSTKKLHKVRI